MKCIHNTRDESFRAPLGAVMVGQDVTLAIELEDAQGASAVLRTWSGMEGERFYDMTPVPGQADSLTRYEAQLTCENAGVVWYRFDITEADGCVRYLGAADGCVGGAGVVRDWEPPSFQLSVHVPADYPPAWHEPIADYLRGREERGMGFDLGETLATLRENFPVRSFATALPWDFKEIGAEAAVENPQGMQRPVELAADGAAACFAEGNVFGFWRASNGGAAVCVLMNASSGEGCDVALPLADDEVVCELTAGYRVPVVDADDVRGLIGAEGEGTRFARVHLDPLGMAMLQFDPVERLGRPMEAGLGILAHVTSLPAPEGATRGGTLGAPARAFVDWLVEAGARYWQVLPVNPTDYFGSPYAGISALAGHVDLLEEDTDPDVLVAADASGYEAFCERERDWLAPYAAFMAIREKIGTGMMWQDWPQQYRQYDPALVEGDEDLRASDERWRRIQFAFDVQWRELRSYANERGVQIVGDMPIYVCDNSADVWSNPGIFQLGPDGKPAVIAGCPPDAFSPDGQTWGNPVYDWDAVRAQGWDWWLRRLKRAFDLYDYVRLDHFIGFSRYFSIPNGCKAVAGTYYPGPGIELFRVAREQFGPLPVIAEDLGLITCGVRSLIASCGFPGMDIAQFADGGDPLAYYEPRPDKVVYTGTHDNQTTAGFCQVRYPDSDMRQSAQALVERVVGCAAPVVVLPLQDVLLLDDAARMNTPGTTEGNWVWQADAADVQAALPFARDLVELRRSAVAATR